MPNLAQLSVGVTGEATGVALVNAVHRGETSAAAWRSSIDVMAVVIIAVALSGYAIFLSMGGKVRTALLISTSNVLAAFVLFLR